MTVCQASLPTLISHTSSLATIVSSVCRLIIKEGTEIIPRLPFLRDTQMSDDALPIIFNIACDHVVKLTLPRKRFSEHLVQTEDLAGLTFEAKSFKKKCIHGWPADGTVSRARVENSTIWDETGKEIFTAGLL